MSNIPNEYHFIWGLTPPGIGKPFVMVHYIAIVSCYNVNKPDKINFYYAYEPSGPWWEKAKSLLNLIQVFPPIHVYGRRLEHAAHKADVLRLEILLEKGGVYLDLDVLSIRSFADLLDMHLVMGEEYEVGLCNAVILAEPNSRFIKAWLSSYESFDEANWNEHSVRVPMRLSGSMPEVRVMDHRKFFWPIYSRKEDLRNFLMFEGSDFCSESYCVHLWESVTWDFISVLEPADLWMSESEFFLLARKHLIPVGHDDPPFTRS
jgi:hypothetical protein